MDIYKFIESKAIREYWKKIGFVPDSLQSAYLIFNCSNHEITLKEKQAAYQEIIRCGTDIMIEPRPWFNRKCSLKSYLNELLCMQNNMISKFFTQARDAFYAGKIHYFKTELSFSRDTGYFKTFDELKENYSQLNSDEYIVISRCEMGYGKRPISISFNHDYEIAGNGILGESASKEEGEILFGLHAFFFDFPYPFKTGDLVFSNLTGPYKPLILMKDPKWTETELIDLSKCGDDTYMNIQCKPFKDQQLPEMQYCYHPLLCLDYY